MTPLVAPEPGFNDDESGARIVFAIARRVPPPNTPQKFLNTRIVSGSAKQIPHTTVETIISHKSNLLTNFIVRHHAMARSLFKPFFSTSYCTSCEAVFLARLVEAEIVSPYHGILINTVVGNPTAPSIAALGE